MHVVSNEIVLNVYSTTYVTRDLLALLSCPPAALLITFG